MSRKTLTIPVGAQHISLLEPLNFKFKTENEKIVDVESDVGFVHRGIERACTTKFKFEQIGYVVARVCGLCAITHSLAYTTAVENMLEGEVPERAKYLRMLMVELDRIHSHMLCLSHVSENAGFEAKFMEIMGDREPVMDLQEKISGSRVQFDYVSIGGVNRDITTDLAKDIKETLKDVRSKIEGYIEEFENNWSLSLKYRGIGAISLEDAYTFNALGPLGRAAGLKIDARAETSYLPYDKIGFEMVLGTNGDIHDRNIVRLKEILHSITLCENIIDGLPEGEVFSKHKGKPEGEEIIRLEAPRGELMYYVKGSKKPILDRVRIKTPTFATVPAMVEIFKGSEYGDAPAILASFDPCLSCTAK